MTAHCEQEPAIQASELTPRERISEFFGIVLDEMDRNPAFAKRIVKAVGAAGSEAALMAATPKPQVQAPEALLAMDLQASREELGRIGLRAHLAQFKNAELMAFIRSKEWAQSGLSKKNKTQLVNLIMRASKEA